MTVRCRSVLAAVLGLSLAHPVLGQEPAPLDVDSQRALAPRPESSVNQKTADTIAEHLRQSGQLRQFNIDVAYHNGTAQLSGTVADGQQREEAVRLVQGVAGVERVLDHLTVTGPVTQVQNTQVLPPAQPTAPVPPLAPVAPVPLAPRTNGAAEPVPIYQTAPQAYYDLNPPAMPPYAWPTYAPYNNYSRVAYPLAYPYNAWPFIGPMYPFPKVPLGWRSVKLEWQDGHWWYSKTSTKYDFWRIRYW